MRFDYAVVKQLAAPASPEIPALELPGEVDLGVYDSCWTYGSGASYPRVVAGTSFSPSRHLARNGHLPIQGCQMITSARSGKLRLDDAAG